MSDRSDPDPWYRDGLRFECTRCGNGCSGTPGSVLLLGESEIAALAQQLELGVEEFRACYTRTLRKGDVSLRERRSGECVLYQNGSAEGTTPGCSVYPQRPRQCRTWPFWRGVVHSVERWAEEAEDCPGINRGALHSPAQIRETSARDGTRSAH